MQTDRLVSELVKEDIKACLEQKEHMLAKKIPFEKLDINHDNGG